jgi:serine protease Do
VASVARNSAAAKAGLKPGDVITEVNGEPVVRSGSLSSLIGMASPGDKVKLKVWRDRGSIDVDATLGGAEDAQRQAANDEQADRAGQLGLALRPLSRDERRQVETEGSLLVENVTGAAARAGIERGDVLIAINGKPVTSVEQIKSVMSGKPKSVALLVERDGERIFVPVNLG